MAITKMSLIKKHINSSMWLQYLTLVVMSTGSLAALFFVYRDEAGLWSSFYDFYQKSLRGYLFSGFISVGSFLLSLHTFVIVNLKEKLFGTPDYKTIFASSKGIDESKVDETEMYKPLDNLSCFINLSIWLAIITAIAQFTLGISNNSIASIACVFLAILTIFFMLNSLIIIRENIKIFLKQGLKK